MAKSKKAAYSDLDPIVSGYTVLSELKDSTKCVCYIRLWKHARPRRGPVPEPKMQKKLLVGGKDPKIVGGTENWCLGWIRADKSSKTNSTIHFVGGGKQDPSVETVKEWFKVISGDSHDSYRGYQYMLVKANEIS